MTTADRENQTTQIAGLTQSLGSGAVQAAKDALQRRQFTMGQTANFAAVNTNLAAQPIATPNRACKGVSLTYTPSGGATNLAADAANYRTFALNKYYANGALAFAVATANWSNVAVNQLVPQAFTMSTNASNLACAVGETLGVTSTCVGAGTVNALFGGVFTLDTEEYSP